jgi:hypothetical protein
MVADFGRSFVATHIIDFDSYSSDEEAARGEARNKLGGRYPDTDLRAVDSGPGPGFAANGPMTHWAFEFTT